MSGINSFVVNWECGESHMHWSSHLDRIAPLVNLGCVFSEKAMIEAKSDTCYGCGGPFNKQRLIVIYPDGDLLRGYQEAVAREQSVKKPKKHATVDGGETSNG